MLSRNTHAFPKNDIQLDINNNTKYSCILQNDIQLYSNNNMKHSFPKNYIQLYINNSNTTHTCMHKAAAGLRESFY